MFGEMATRNPNKLSDITPCDEEIQTSGFTLTLRLYSPFPRNVDKSKPVPPILDRVDQSIPSTRGSDKKDSDRSPRTPTGTTFDPFAPGPESLIFAPGKRSEKKLRTFHPFQRKLEFDSFVNANTSPDTSFSCLSWLSPSSITGNQDMEMELSQDSEKSDQADVKFGCKTPRESTIDTFAPGPEELIFAPKKKTAKESQIPVQRKLDFDSDHHQNHQEQEEAEILGKFYRSILEILEPYQLKEPTDSRSPVDPLILFEGSPMTCPGAPVRRVRRTRKLDAKICRKLEF